MSICPPNQYYYIDPRDIGNPYRFGPYDGRRNPVLHYGAIDPIGNVQLLNDQLPTEACSCLTFINDTSGARDDLIRTQQRKYNSTVWAAGQRGGQFLPLDA